MWRMAEPLSQAARMFAAGTKFGDDPVSQSYHTPPQYAVCLLQCILRAQKAAIATHQHTFDLVRKEH